MLGSQGGFAGTGPNPGGGGNAGLPGGTNGQSTGSSGGNCGYTYGYLSGSGGAGGPAGGSQDYLKAGLTGSPGGLFYAGNGGSAPIMDGAGGNGGFGYYGGGGGGGGWQYGPRYKEVVEMTRIELSWWIARRHLIRFLLLWRCMDPRPVVLVLNLFLLFPA